MTVIDEYFEKITYPQKKELQRIRSIIKSVVPEAEEVIDYGMPAFKYKGKYLMGFFVFKNHMSIFPTADPINALKTKLGNFQISKGTIQFTLENIIPDKLIKDLLLRRIYDLDRDLDEDQ